MLTITPALGLFCLLFGSTSTFAAPTGRITERSFNPRQKWQSDEVNCVQILNPAVGASYRPGYFVRMIYGTGLCSGATAAGPWTIHLYNNPDIQGGSIRYDYHEVLADGVSRYTVWNDLYGAGFFFSAYLHWLYMHQRSKRVRTNIPGTSLQTST